jgi:hypothetical protein
MILKFNFRVEIILLVIILILMLVAPMLLSCTNHSPYKLLEGFVEGFVEGVAKTLNEDDKKKSVEPFDTMTSDPNTEKKKKVIPGISVPAGVTDSPDTDPTTTPTEGFSNLNKKRSKHKLWKSEIPLIFDNTPFSPECCPTTYSNSLGCACMSMPQYTYLIERGGNNVPFSQY